MFIHGKHAMRFYQSSSHSVQDSGLEERRNSRGELVILRLIKNKKPVPARKTDERRIHQRYRASLPMRLQIVGGAESMAVSSNVSQSGILAVADRSHGLFSTVFVRLMLGTEIKNEYSASAMIVRVGKNSLESKGTWPFTIALAFTSPVPEIELLLQQRGAALA